MTSAILLPLLYTLALFLTRPLRHPVSAFSAIAGMTTWAVLTISDRSASSDIPVYIDRFESLDWYTVQSIWDGTITALAKDPAFWISAKIMSDLGSNTQVWLATISAVFAGIVAYVVTKTSSDPWLSFVALSSLGYVAFSGTALRQTVALSLVFLAIHHTVNRKNIWASLFLICLAATFHSSAVLAIIILGIRHLTLRASVITTSIAVIGAILFPIATRELIGTVGWTTEISEYQSRQVALTWSLFIVHAGILLICYALGALSNSGPRDRILFQIALAGLPFFALATQLAEGFRAGLYFSMIEILLLPNAIRSIDSANSRAILTIACSASLVVYAILSDSAEM